MTFGEALIALKEGKRLTRKGWNGKNLSVVYQKGYPEGIPCNQNTAEAWGLEPGDLFKCEPYLQISTVDGSHAMWVPSIRDCLAEDWEVVGREKYSVKNSFDVEDIGSDIQRLRNQIEKAAYDLLIDHVLETDKHVKSVSIELVLEKDE